MYWHTAQFGKYQVPPVCLQNILQQYEQCKLDQNTFFNLHIIYKSMCLAQLVEWLVPACVRTPLLPHFVFLGKTLNSQCLPRAEEFHQYIIAIYVCGLHQHTKWCLTGSSAWVSSHSYQANG